MGKVKARPQISSPLTTLNQSLGLNRTIRLSASNALALVTGVGWSRRSTQVTESVSFSDQVTVGIPKKEYPFEVIAFTQSASASKPIVRSVTQSLVLSQTVVPTIWSGTASSQIAFTQSATGVRPKLLVINHNMSLGNIFDLPPEDIPEASDPDFVTKLQEALKSLTLRQEVSVRRTITNVSASSAISLSQGSARAAADTQAVSSHIHLSDSARTVLAVSVSSTLNLTQSIVAQGSLNLEGEITFTQTVAYTGVWLRSASSASTFTQSFDQGLVDGLPGVPGGLFDSGASAPLGENLGTDYRQVQGRAEVPLVRSNSVTFTFPFVSPTNTVVLRTPNLGDKETLNYRRVARNTRGGKFELYRRSIWPKWNRHQMTFSALTQEQRVAILQFLHESVGKDVGFLDHEGRQWKGIITTPAALVQEMGKLHQNEVTLEFQGELV